MLCNDISRSAKLDDTSSERHLMKSIFLVNPISGRGHLDSYARLYARALLELGYRVVLVACMGERDASGRDVLDKLDRSISQIRVSLDKACH